MVIISTSALIWCECARFRAPCLWEYFHFGIIHLWPIMYWEIGFDSLNIRHVSNWVNFLRVEFLYAFRITMIFSIDSHLITFKIKKNLTNFVIIRKWKSSSLCHVKAQFSGVNFKWNIVGSIKKKSLIHQHSALISKYTRITWILKVDRSS